MTKFAAPSEVDGWSLQGNLGVKINEFIAHKVGGRNFGCPNVGVASASRQPHICGTGAASPGFTPCLGITPSPQTSRTAILGLEQLSVMRSVSFYTAFPNNVFYRYVHSTYVQDCCPTPGCAGFPHNKACRDPAAHGCSAVDILAPRSRYWPKVYLVVMGTATLTDEARAAAFLSCRDRRVWM